MFFDFSSSLVMPEVMTFTYYVFPNPEPQAPAGEVIEIDGIGGGISVINI